MDPYIGEIRIVGFSFAPIGWALCNGQLLPIAQNTALFNLIGTTYGGDGQTTFGLPDFRGRVPVHQGSGGGLSPRVIGEMAGVETVTLTTNQIPAHNHAVAVSATLGSSVSPVGNYIAAGDRDSYAPPGAPVAMSSNALGSTGSSQPHENRQSFLAMNFIIAVEGIYPSQ